MGIVIMHSVMSVDGFIADGNGGVGPLHEWYFSGDTPISEGGDRSYDRSGMGGGFGVSSTSADYVRPSVNRCRGRVGNPGPRPATRLSLAMLADSLLTSITGQRSHPAGGRERHRDTQARPGAWC